MPLPDSDRLHIAAAAVDPAPGNTAPTTQVAGVGPSAASPAPASEALSPRLWHHAFVSQPALSASEENHTAELNTDFKLMLDTLSVKSDDEDEAARDLLNAIISSDGSGAVRSLDKIRTLFARVTQRRDDYIEKIASERGVSQPTESWEYTTEAWRTYLKSNSFTENDMTGAVKAWKEHFKENEFRETVRVQELLEEDTRDSKAAARRLVNGAFKSHLKDEYGRAGLAIEFLRTPPAMVDTLLAKWREYMRSDEYLKEKERACRDRTAEKKAAEVEAKMKVCRLRDQKRKARRMEREKWHLRPDQNILYQRYITGSLDQELDDAVRQHGYGQLSSGEFLGAFGLNGYD